MCLTINPSKDALKSVPQEIVVSFVDMSAVSSDGFITEKKDVKLSSVRNGSYTYFAEGDIIIAKITPCMENGKCAIADGLTNKIGMGSSEFHVFRVDSTKVINRFVFGYLNRKSIRTEASKSMTGASGHRRVPISFYKNLLIPVPSLSEQQNIIEEIAEYEQAIGKAQQVMDSCAQRKREVLNRYLG